MPKYKGDAYLRLSYSADRSVESDSIANQKKLIEDFVAAHPDIELVSERVDDGYSGVLFDRPAFQEMMNDIVSGKINCVIVKDLSRLGREYIETGRYLRQVFPAYGVRFISINDGIDTANEQNGDDLHISLKNLLKNKCHSLVGSTFSPKFRQGYIFSHNQTNIPIEHLNILVALTVYNGTLTDFNMVNQFVYGGPVKFLQVQIFSDDCRPIMNGGDFLFCRVYLGQKNLQPFGLGHPLLFIFLHQHNKGILTDCPAVFVLIEFGDDSLQLLHTTA